jgi:ankyrin repeat protein
MLLSAFADTHVTDDDRRTPAMLAELCGHTELLPYLRYTLSYSPGILERVSNNNNSVSISLMYVKDSTRHNKRNKKTSRPGTTSKSTKRANMRVV